MQQFIDGDERAWAELEQRAGQACVCFDHQPLPPGAEPPRTRVGFEVHRTTGVATLHVAAGGRYGGDNQSVSQWLTDGLICFNSFAGLMRWVRGELAAAYHQPGGESPALAPEQITDLDAVQQNAPRHGAGLYLDEAELDAALAQSVRGQEEAIKTMAAAASRHLARVRPRRPGVLFSVGPTGVGKTHAARALPWAMRQTAGQDTRFGFLRLDMSEYQEAHRVSQLLGAPQGYVGYSDGSQLLDALTANPRQVVLFDEIEKAHPAILRALMNAMDAGRLSSAARTEAGGREVDCSQALFIFTSNIDADGILSDLADENARRDPARRDEVCRKRLLAANLAPEIVGRIGRFMVFWPLTQQARAEIAVMAVVEVADEYGLEMVHVDPAIVVKILGSSENMDFGARVDRYAVDDLLGPAMARAGAAGLTGQVEVLDGEQGEGPRVVGRAVA